MGSEEQGVMTLAALRRAREQRAAVARRITPAGLLTIIVLADRSKPSLGWHGVPLGISIALAAFVAAVITAFLVGGSRRVQPALPVVLLVIATTLMWLQPSGPGVVGLTFSVVYGLQVLRGWRAVALSVAAVLSFLLYLTFNVSSSYLHKPGVGLAAVLALALTVVAAVFGRRVREQDEQASRMLAELEQARGAELRAAALGERQRLAREVHDVLAHSLSGLVMQLEGARLLAATDPADPRLGGTIDRAHHLARNGLDEARRAISMLRGDELPGPERIEAMAAEFARDSAIPCRFGTEGEPRDVGSETRLALYRTAQEALTNIRKHADAERALVTLRYEPREVRLVIEDISAAGSPGMLAGPGDLAAQDGTGYGLTGMRERAELLGGTLTAAPTGRGFRVELRVPG